MFFEQASVSLLGCFSSTIHRTVSRLVNGLTAWYRQDLPCFVYRRAPGQNNNDCGNIACSAGPGGDSDETLLVEVDAIVKSVSRSNRRKGAKTDVILLSRKSMQALRHQIRVTYKHQPASRHLLPTTILRFCSSVMASATSWVNPVMAPFCPWQVSH